MPLLRSHLHSEAGHSWHLLTRSGSLGQSQNSSPGPGHLMHPGGPTCISMAFVAPRSFLLSLEGRWPQMSLCGGEQGAPQPTCLLRGPLPELMNTPSSSLCRGLTPSPTLH